MRTPHPSPNREIYPFLVDCGREGYCRLHRILHLIREWRNSNDLGSACRHGLRPWPAPTRRYACILRVGAGKRVNSVTTFFPTRFRNGHFPTIHDLRTDTARVQGRPQPGDTPVFSRLGPEGGAIHRVPLLLRDSETAESQRFGILKTECPAYAPAPTGRICPYFAGRSRREMLRRTPRTVRRIWTGGFPRTGRLTGPTALRRDAYNTDRVRRPRDDGAARRSGRGPA